LTTLNVSSAATDSDIPANTLTYALLQGPAGMTIDPNTGRNHLADNRSRWTDTNLVIVSATDDGTPPLSATNNFTVIVTEVNSAPLLTVPSGQTINELATLNVSASATDSDLPANILTFSLLAPPAGMTIVSGTGAINWTPTEPQGPSTNVITVVVTDNGTPALSATNSFTVTVNEANTAPSLPAIADRTIHAGQALTFTIQPRTQMCPQYIDLQPRSRRACGRDCRCIQRHLHLGHNHVRREHNQRHHRSCYR